MCPRCGRTQLKRMMRPLYTAESSSMPPRLLCYMCENCYLRFLEEYEIQECM
nr:MAG TPA: transcription factor IIS-like protein [Caudoviricetes sp.]